MMMRAAAAGTTTRVIADRTRFATPRPEHSGVSFDDVLLDPADAHPELAVVRAALARRDWPACRAVLDSAAPGGRTWLLSWAAQERGIEETLRYALHADPADGAAAALLGMHLTDVAWAARGRARAARVGAEQFAIFQDWLRRAEAVLIDGAARTPGDPALWAARLTTARGLQLGPAETRRRYDRMLAAHPHDYAGQAQYLQSLCPKWGGDWPRAHAWAAEATAAAPPGAAQGSLVAIAHLENWLELDEPEATAYLREEAVRDAVAQAAHRSVWHADFRREPGWVPAASAFAMAFSLMDERPAAGAVFAMLGRLAHRFPFSYLGGDPAAVVAGLRDRSLSPVGGVR
ncbi:hypothetical protein ACPL_5051 [Actinoplanes sp. SE50/110]|nr:hypothetical protein ACPL_5051 [Actinoplanes sp. SE50/110]